MKNRLRRVVLLGALALVVLIGAGFLFSPLSMVRIVFAQTQPVPTPKPTFDQAAAIAKLREQIKGRENEPASAVFKNLQMLKSIPAGRLLSIMEMGYARSLGVTCTHCHISGKWESEEKPQKQIAREMAAMVGRINGELLKNIKNLQSASPTINCTTCHRGGIKPALNLSVR